MYKVVNGQLQAAPETYRDGKKIITNFDKNKGQQKKYGYKELKEVDVPEYNLETLSSDDKKFVEYLDKKIKGYAELKKKLS